MGEKDKLTSLLLEIKMIFNASQCDNKKYY